ncbi:MAG: cytochrome P450 [Anaerolineae bacterium]|nr:cytochrome P450 [Anaerolineae bacterium]
MTETLPLPPGETGLPLIGETLAFVRSPREFTAKREQKYGKVFRTHILGAESVILIGHAANHWAFSGEDKYLQNRWSYGVRQILGADTMSLINGERHRERRRMVTPHFKYESMSHFVPSIEALSRQHMERWANQGSVLTIEHAMRTLAFEIIALFIFSDEADQLDLPYLSELSKLCADGMFTPITINLPFLPFGKALKARKDFMNYLRPFVQKRRESGQHKADVLGTLLAARDSEGNGLSDETIVEEIHLLLFAGHDTTVTSNTNILLHLAQNPHALQCARDEQNALAPDDRVFNLDTLKKMPYLDAVIHESMRLIPPIAGMFRITIQDVEFNGYRIPKGTVILLNPARTHRDETVWKNVEDYNPDRWLSGEKQPPFSHIPFGGGPRLCLGQNFAMVEMKLILSLLLRGYRWELVPHQDLTYRSLPFPLPKSGVTVQFSRL